MGRNNFERYFSFFNFRLGTYNVPSGSSAKSLTRRPKAGRARSASLMGRVGRMGRSRKVSFKILQTLWAFRTYIYILVYEIKIVTNILMGFKIWCQVGGGGIQFSKLPYVREFSNIWFQKLTDIRCISHFFENLKNVFSNAYLKKFGSKRVNFLFVFIWIQT